MLRITFKDVGQGDTILIEWSDNETPKIGIIDCNLKFSTNPALNHIVEKDYKEIDFIILSHPHYDHFSGMLQLLNHCEEKGIIVKRFLHTCQNVPDYLRVAHQSFEAEKALEQLFRKLKYFRKTGQIIQKEAYVADNSRHIELGDEATLSFLAPSSIEFNKFISRISISKPLEDVHSNPLANWLSTVIKISYDDSYILLTSDAEKATLTKIVKTHVHEKTLEGNLILAQIPHHGSESNHSINFWRKRTRTPLTPIVFSVGENQYGHPSKKVVTDLVELKYEVYSTNEVGTFKTYKQTVIETSFLLDHLTTRTINQKKIITRLQGDKAFEIVEGKASWVSD